MKARKKSFPRISLAAALVVVIAAYGFTGHVERGLDHAVTQAVLERVSLNHAVQEQDFCVEAHKVLASTHNRDARSVTVYLTASALRYRFAEDGWKEESGFSSVPMALTFSTAPSGRYELTSFWEASDGELYRASIKETFPAAAYYLHAVYPSGLLTTACELQGWYHSL